MKLTKMLGVAAIAAVAAMAFIGANSASAAVFCLSNVSSCTETKETVHMLSAKGEGKFVSGFVTVECHVEATATNGAEFKITFAFKECSGCTTVEATVSKATLTATGGGNGLIEGTGDATFKGCPFGAECKYHGEGVKTILDGSATNALALVVKQSLKKSGGSGLCNETGEWNAMFHGVSAEDKMTFIE
ncbi:MAG TPA: hypothetical protein VHU14_03615 [Solirubrobacterales bacterium]|nr:hypothetical protein [Solirubrobacterales bacterium]